MTSLSRRRPFSEDLYQVGQLYDRSYKVVVSKSHPLNETLFLFRHSLKLTCSIDQYEMRDALHGACADQGHELYAAYRSNRVDWLVGHIRGRD